MSPIAFLERCLACGMDLETALKAAKAFEAEVLPVRPERSKAAERQARYRRNKASQTITRDVTHNERDVRDAPHVRAQSRVVTPFSSSLRSEEVGGGVVGEREAVNDWPEGGSQAHAKLLVEAVGSPWLDPTKSSELWTTIARLAAWKRDGASWEHDVLPVVTGLCANRRGRIASWKFFDAAIARSIADNHAALAIPEAGTVRATGPPNIMDRMKAERLEAERLAFEMLDARDGRTN